MMYWGDMCSKSGFGDGDQYPAGVELYRDTYLKVINAIAERFGSECRYAPYNRPGMHNYWLVIPVQRSWFEDIYLPTQKDSEMWADATEEVFCHGVSEFDDAMNDAFLAISELDLDIDRYIEVMVRRSPEFPDFLTGIRNGLLLTEFEEIE